ncbi:MAG: long-chain-fatty-acid--CoA ligase [Novosphingobium sp.]
MRFTQGLERVAQQRPNDIATICGDRQQTFTQLHNRTTRFAGALASLGLGKGAKVAILSLNSDYYLESYLGIAWAGAICVPLNFRWSVPEIVYALNDSACTALIVDDHHAPLIAQLREECPLLAHVMLTGSAASTADTMTLEGLIATATPAPNADAGGDDLFGIFYTGGTTGRSKGVMLSHGNLCTSALSLMAEGLLRDNCVGMHAAPMFHLADMLQNAALVLRGATHVMLPAFTPQSALEQIARHGVTDTLIVPAMIQAMADCPARAQYDTSSLRSILYGASPASEALLRRAMDAFPNLQLTQGYGMTETSALLTVLPWREHAPADGKPTRLRSAGRATYDVVVRIVDGNDNEVPRGEVGEIVARGANIMQGYLNMPELTAETLRGDWLHTGDMGWMDEEGYVFIVDRAKDMIISGGENVFSAEVENAVASHPSVATNAVIGIPDDKFGEAVHAVVVLHPDADLTLADLQTHCRKTIAGYKVPRSMEVIAALPMSGAGKVLKNVLRERWSENNAR